MTRFFVDNEIIFLWIVSLDIGDVSSYGEEIDEESGSGGIPSGSLPLECRRHRHNIIKNQRDALKGYENLSKADCGGNKKYWKWWRDRKISTKKARKRVV